jgi:hypothetical protein
MAKKPKRQLTVTSADLKNGINRFTYLLAADCGWANLGRDEG